MARLLEETIGYTLVNNKCKRKTTLQPTIKILNECSYVSEDTK